METKSKKKVFNVIMVALIVVIVGCGIMAIGNIKGWFGGNSDSPMMSSEIVGVANVERSDVGYTLEEGTEINSGDILETKQGSEANFIINKKNNVAISENTEFEATTCDENSIVLTINNGDMFADISKAPDTFTIVFGDNEIQVHDSVFSISSQKGSAELNVYSGDLSVTTADGNKEVNAGKQMLVVTADDETEVSVSKLQAAALSEFQIEKLQASENGDLCFTNAQLKKVVEARNAEKKEAQKALEEEAIAIVEEQENGTSGSGSSSTTSSSDVKTCTVSINCKTILNNMGSLKSGKNQYVPSNGVILATSSVQFRDGDTAYDVTKRVCSAAGIQMEASYSPGYGSYYVEGINHLYEFDCGDLSGWIYKVNGWAPNYGCSEYKLKDGDSIVWAYTCKGAGADVK